MKETFNKLQLGPKYIAASISQTSPTSLTRFRDNLRIHTICVVSLGKGRAIMSYPTSTLPEEAIQDITKNREAIVSSPANDNSFSVVTYNILADCHMEPTW